MRTISIAIAVEDNDYAEALAAALVRNVKGLTITIIDGSDFEAQAETYDPVRYDAVLTDMNLSRMTEKDPSRYAGIDADSVIHLSEQAAPGMICKYGSVREIAGAVLSAADRTVSVHGTDVQGMQSMYPSANALRFENETDIYTFLSDTGGSGCTSCAMGFSESLALDPGKRILYIDASPIPLEVTNARDREAAGAGSVAGTSSGTRFGAGASTGSGFGVAAGANNGADPGADGSRNMRKLLYHISEGKDMSRLLSTYVTENEMGVSTIDAYSGLSPLASAPADLFEALLGCIEKSGLFDAVVIDAGNHLTNAVLAAAAISKRVFAVYDCRRMRPGIGKRTDAGAQDFGRHLIEKILTQPEAGIANNDADNEQNGAVNERKGAITRLYNMADDADISAIAGGAGIAVVSVKGFDAGKATVPGKADGAGGLGDMQAFVIPEMKPGGPENPTDDFNRMMDRICGSIA